MKTETHKVFGFALVCIGVTGFIAAVAVGHLLAEDVRSALPALSFLVLMIGFAFCFPSLLEEAKNELSTMRMIVFAVTMVFCVVYIRLAWNLQSFEKFTIDEKWVYILGLAFGGKVIQRFGEAEDSGSGDSKTDEKKKDVSEKSD